VKALKLLSIVGIAFLIVRCSPSLIATAIVSAPKIVKSEDARNRAQSLKRDSLAISSDSVNYASYYIYRNGSFVGSALSCLVYDNNQYVAIANLRTFEKVDHVIPGDHIFTSKVDSKKSVKVHFDAGKTYIIQVFASTTIKEGVLFMMDQNKIKKEISKGLFFSEKFAEKGLKVDDISYNDQYASRK
jgi:hypothetical protein